MLKKWLELIPCDLLQKKSVVILSTCKYVTYILNLVLLREKSHILKIGYTTLFLESEISTGIPLNRSEGIQNVNALDDHQHVMKRHYDHTYFKTEVLESYPHMMPINTGKDAGHSTFQVNMKLCNIKT
ncbi:unnamed protein product [Parnassius mnemosyne]|uniref:Uncharacterized protein n=1 Tax=Parnassius mnemosyne TaxID=213953 RepID=A0AAV1KM32_9NEOP